MASEALRMVIRLKIDESLRKNFAQYQQSVEQESNSEISSKSTQQQQKQCTFPSQIKMFPWNDIHQITQHIYRQTKIPTTSQRLFFRGKEITKNRKNKKLSSPTLSSLGIVHESIIYLQCDYASFDVSPIVLYGSMNKLSDSEKHLISECRNGIYDDMKPILSQDGEGGTYFLRDSKNTKIACFKPSDEEAGAINNPRGRCNPQQAMHCGIKPTEGHLREIAAYLIDNDHFHAVPSTIRVEIAYKNGFNYNNNNHNNQQNEIKVGALQQFIVGEVIENFAEQNFAIREVHKIGILDIRILNCDRNSGNVLVSRDEYGRYDLIPIDHGLSLPEKIEIVRDSWVWLGWKQSKEPFDPYSIEFINKIDIEEDIKKLKSSLNFKQIIFENMRISHLVLLKCANSGLTLHDIGSIISRPDFETKSILEELMVQAESLAIEKIRQSKHLMNRIKIKRTKSNNEYGNSNTPKFGSIKSEQININNHNNYHHHHILKKQQQNNIKSALKMPYVPSLAPPSSSTITTNGNIRSNNYQILTRNKSNTIAADSSCKLSPIPRLNLLASSLSVTPEPFMLFKPKAIIVSKAKKNCNEDEKEQQQSQIEIPFWTPNYRATSMTSVLSKQASDPKLFRSVTPDRTQRERKQYDDHHRQSKKNNINTNEIPEIFLLTPRNNEESDDEEEESTNVPYSICSPLELEYHQSIHDRFENEKVSSVQPMNNTILKNISVPSQSSEENVLDENDQTIAKNLYDLQHEITKKDEKEEIDTSINGYKVQSFSSLKLDSLQSQKVKQKEKEKDLIPLSRSTSCIDVRKRSLSKMSSLEPISQAQKSVDTQGVSDDFLYRNGRPNDLKSASLINHNSMTQKRNEMLSLSLINSHSPSLTSANMDSVKSLMNMSQNGHLNDSPSNGSVSAQAQTTPSNQSQDDLFQQHAEFGIFPIMERMTTNSYEFRKWFMHYLDQLLGIQCERILNRLRKSDDGKDNIYDVDTVNGSFIWKNELRIHWARSRLERRRLLQSQIKPLINPFDHKPSPKKKKIKKKVVVQMKDADEEEEDEFDLMCNNGVLNVDEIEDESVSEDEEEEDEWFGAEGLVDIDG